MLQKAGECKARGCGLPTIRGGRFLSGKGRIKHGESVILKCEGYDETVKCNFGQLSPAPMCNRNGKEESEAYGIRVEIAFQKYFRELALPAPE